METNSLTSTDAEFGVPVIVRRGAFDLVFVATLFALSWVAVSLAYGNRFNHLVWASITLPSVGLPAYIGIARNRTSELAVWIAMLLCVACPIVYIVADSNEQLRDLVFLGIGCTVLFVSTAWATRFLLVSKKLQASLLGGLSLCSLIAVIAMTTIYMYLV